MNFKTQRMRKAKLIVVTSRTPLQAAGRWVCSAAGPGSSKASGQRQRTRLQMPPSSKPSGGAVKELLQMPLSEEPGGGAAMEEGVLPY